MEDILESVRRIIYRWSKTNTLLSSSASKGDTIINVDSSIRFRKGDEITIHDGSSGEPPLIIKSIVDDTTIELETPIATNGGWNISSGNKFVEKLINGTFVQGIYIGNPVNIPRFPAITIMGEDKSSEWLTLGTTKERFNIQIAIYVEDGNNEDGYRTLLKLTSIIEKGLKKNIFPLVGDFNTTNITANISATDEVIKVSDSSIFQVDQKIVLEDIFKAEELRVCEIIDSNTIRVFPIINNDYLVSNDSKIIALTRFIFNSWPANIDYGFVHKGTFLKASTISWFAEEQEVQTRGGWSDPQLS